MKKIYLISTILLFVLFFGIDNTYATTNLNVGNETLDDKITTNTTSTAVYDIDKNTLTLKNYDGKPIQYYGEEDLTVILDGNNTITDEFSEIGFYSPNAGIVFDGTGSLLIKNTAVAIGVEGGDLKVNNVNINIENIASDGIGVTKGNLIINGQVSIDINAEEAEKAIGFGHGIIGIQTRDDVEINGNLIIKNIDSGLNVHGNFIVKSGNSSVQTAGTVIHCAHKFEMLGGNLDLKMTDTDTSYRSYAIDTGSLKISGGYLHVLTPKGKIAIKVLDEYSQDTIFEIDDTMEIIPNKYSIQEILLYETVKAKTIGSSSEDIANEVTIKEKYTYEYIRGTGLKFVQNKTDKYELVIDGDYSLFDKLTIETLDLVKDIDYTVKEGSTIVTFTESGLNKINKLTPGKYNVSANYTNGKVAETDLIVLENNNSENPNTNDNVRLYMICIVISLIGIYSTLYYRKIRS